MSVAAATLAGIAVFAFIMLWAPMMDKYSFRLDTEDIQKSWRILTIIGFTFWYVYQGLAR